MKTLVLGATGLLGNAVFRVMNERDPQTVGTVRSLESAGFFPAKLRGSLAPVRDLMDIDELEELFRTQKPQVVINCVAARREQWNDPEMMIGLFSVLPQRVSFLCARHGARMVHVSSDGVFSGIRGNYTEEDLPDAVDLYGMAKQLGEPQGDHAITLRTSIIGHGIHGTNGLVDWFLAQSGGCRGFSKAVFTGFPTVVLARLIGDVILPRSHLHGVFHLATPPISKLDLLRLIADRYGKHIEIVPDDSVALDRSLVATKFENATGYVPPSWQHLIEEMYVDKHSGGHVH